LNEEHSTPEGGDKERINMSCYPCCPFCKHDDIGYDLPNPDFNCPKCAKFLGNEFWLADFAETFPGSVKED